MNQDRNGRTGELVSFREPQNSPLEATRSQNCLLNAGKSGHEEIAVGCGYDPLCSRNEVQGETDGWIVAFPGQLAGLGGLMGPP
jgi:hypothetical protein